MTDTACRILTAKGGKTHLFSMGQAGFVIKSKNGTLLGVDLYLSQCVERVEGHDGFKRLLPAPLDVSEVIFDHIVVTHPHYDHFDADSVPFLIANGHTKLYGSVNCEKEINRLMLKNKNIRYVKTGEAYQIDDMRIKCVFCDHGEGAPDAFGLVVTVDKMKLYFAGDTCLRLDKTEEIKAEGPFDIMIAPINGAYGNLNEAECITLAQSLQPKLVIPCHYGMFAAHGGNPGQFMNLIRESLPAQKYRLMALGEQFTLN